MKVKNEDIQAGNFRSPTRIGTVAPLLPKIAHKIYLENERQLSNS